MARKVSAEALRGYQEQFDCANRGDLDEMQALYAEDPLFDLSAVFTDVPPARGHEQMRRQWDQLRDTWKEMRIDPVEGFDVGEGRLVLDLRLWAEGQQSGVEVEQRFAMLYAFGDDGKICSARLLPDVATAIAAAESPAPQSA